MTRDQFVKAGVRLFGRKHWKAELAKALGVDPSTIHRLANRNEYIPGPYEVAVKGMVAFKEQQDELEKKARQILRQDVRIKREKRKAAVAAEKAKKEKARAKLIDDSWAVVPDLDLAGKSGRAGQVPDPGGEVQGDPADGVGGERPDEGQRDS